MISLIRNVNSNFQKKYLSQEQTTLETSQITELLYATDIKNIQTKTLQYLVTRNRTLLLIDNIDKGWGAHGVDSDDVLIVSTLIDALRKIERQAAKRNSRLDWLVFLRNDVLELLVDQQNDRGKDGKIIVDWDSEAALKKVIEERIRSSGISRKQIDVKWSDIAIPQVDGENSLTWLVKRSLMRPRYLIQLCDECIGHADVCGNEKIEKDDFLSGFKNFSLDIIGNTNFEMRDVLPASEDAIYCLIGLDRSCFISDIKQALVDNGFSQQIEEIIDLFFWFAVFGISSPSGEEKYIYDYRYDQKIFSKMRSTNKDDFEVIFINKAFSKGLDCIDFN